ncbi:SymE family type I addiction module toxin [Yokenella regensburgei]|uniref:SymE family type I addiction module toxin n=1 Tax=Yokenella regensburgei TaxID=158877 RepID=UPI003EDA1E10
MTNPDYIAEITEPVVLPATLRHYTVTYISKYPTLNKSPAIILKGDWLAKAGFTTGSKMEVRVMEGCIVLTSKAPEPEHEALHKRVQRLSKRKQAQIMAFIAMVENKNSAFR